ncbi:Imm26 family immunity protein [Cytophagaceae bacterium DM2B3-1]|uniref:Imm26 family immunity protein n=1 Tax=Xanthocytophaga flava TaxID=3048013 RepID=A0ABT7CV75_9BACT|nr:Imm26 family immunity protein [Xanthocytophaga flavus]MDJ1496835.1 Imm26 family immunity protein [Xanthocytophaga flavus]
MTKISLLKKRRYSIGDVFCVPLAEKGYCLGLITHIHPRLRVPLGCFFKKLYKKVPAIDRKIIRKENVILVKKFGIQGFDDGSWPIIGKLDPFEIKEWPIPIFLRRLNLSPPQFVYYNQDLEEVKSEEVSEGTNLSLYHEDGLGGSGFVENRLIRLFEDNS